MSDDGGHEPHEPHEDDGGFFSAAGILHAVTDVGIGAAHHALGAGARALGIPMGPLGVALGAHELYEGYEKGDVTTGLQGALGMVGGAAGTIEGAGAVIECLLGGGGAGAAGTGAAGAGAAGAGAAGAGAGGLGLSAVAPAAGAGVVGLGIGTGLAHLADNKLLSSPMWGTDSAGHNNTPMDAASNAGHWVDETFGDGSPSFLGGAVTAGLSAPAALLGLTGVADPWVGAAKAEYGLAKAGASWVGGLFD